MARDPYPTADELHDISQATVPPHRRVEALLKAHGLSHGRRARRRFYRRLCRILKASRPMHIGKGSQTIVRALLGMAEAMGAAEAIRTAPDWFLRWLCIEQPWRHPERWADQAFA